MNYQCIVVNKIRFKIIRNVRRRVPIVLIFSKVDSIGTVGALRPNRVTFSFYDTVSVSVRNTYDHSTQLVIVTDLFNDVQFIPDLLLFARSPAS